MKQLLKKFTFLLCSLLAFSCHSAPDWAPGFIIIGAGKSGTTSMYNYLKHHPNIIASNSKEVEFFGFNKFNFGINWYQKQFPTAPDDGKKYLFFEASAGYIWRKDAPKDLFTSFPETKLIVMLRDPIDRAYSNYKMWMRAGKKPISFEDAIDEKSSSVDVNFVIKAGIYVNYLKQWLSYFPQDQFLIVRFEDFVLNPDATVNQVFRFIGLPEFHHTSFPVAYVGSHNANYPINRIGDITPKTRKKLQEFYRPYNQELEELLGMQFNWG